MTLKPRRIAIMLDLSWPFKRHAEIFAGTQKYSQEHGWSSVIDEFAYDTLATAHPKALPYDGVIARANVLLQKQAVRLKVPVVNVWGSSPVYEQVPSVLPDYTSMGEQCAEHLLSRGLRHFTTLTPPKSHVQDLLVQAFVRVVKEAGFECRSDRILQNPRKNLATWRSTVQAIKRYVEQWRFPIGVYVFTESVGRLIAQACQEHGLRVPNDVAIIAGQNEVTLCEHPHPSLTSMELGFERVGYEAARLLHSLMDGNPPPRAPIILPPIGLVVRESTDFFSVDDDQVAAALRFIAANSHKRIGPNEVARAVHMETRTLQNRFGKLLNRPIATEIRRVRLERAKRELTQSKKSLSAIARDVGFGPIMRMYEVFRRELGISPGQYRKQMLLQNGH
jgi:LacI family transcriptional regulator